MSANKEAASSSSSGDAQAKKTVDKLNVREFRECFCIPNGVLVELIDGEVMTIEKSEDNAIFFTNEQFNAGLRFPPPVTVQGIPLLHLDSSSLHPPQYSPGADGMQHSKHVVQPRPLAVGGSFRLLSEEG